MKRGFTNIFKKRYHLVKLEALSSLPGESKVTPKMLLETGHLRKLKYPVKVLGDGEIAVPLDVSAHKFTRSARQKIEAAGGRIQLL